MRSTRAIIHADHLRYNFNVIKNQVGSNKLICCAVKANAYGHGAVDVAKILVEEGADRFAIATLSEAEELRAAGIVLPLQLLSLCHPTEIDEVINLDVIPFICSIEQAKEWQQRAAILNKKVVVHIKVDTGMGRIGCKMDEVNDLVHFIDQQPNLFLEGLASHFASADEHQSETLRAYNLFKQVIDLLPHPLDIYHIANSAAVLTFPDSYLNMVRPGIALYGYHPNPLNKGQVKLKEVMELKSHIIFIKKANKGSKISYGGHFTLQEDSYIATIPVGYADGYHRLLSNRAQVLIKGKHYPIVGNICMDQLMVNIGPQLTVTLYDEVTLFGPDPLGPNADELAMQMESINYELLTSISKRVPRIIV